ELAQIASTGQRAQIALQCGRLAQARGSLAAAHEQYDDALSLAGGPFGSGLLEILALLRRGQLDAINGRWVAAQRDLRRCAARATALGHHGVALSAQLGLASLYRRRGDLGRARVIADGALETLEGSRSVQLPRCHRIRADVRRSAGEFEEAAEGYRRAYEGYLGVDRQ